MKNILNSCFDKTKDDATIINDWLTILLTEDDNYKKNREMPINTILKDKEVEYIKYLQKIYQGIGSFPSKQIFIQNFPETQTSLTVSTTESPLILIATNDFNVYVFQFIDARINQFISARIANLNKKIAVEGVTEEIQEQLDLCKKYSNRNQTNKQIDIKINGKSNYQALKERPMGLQTGIKAIDSRIGGMNEGTLNVIAGFTSQFKSTFALNVAHLNSQLYGYNIVYITLETPKNDMYWDLLSCHSFMSKFQKYRFIGHDKMRQAILNAEEEDYLFGTIETELYAPITNDDGTQTPKGSIIFLDESDFDSFSFGEIQSVLQKIDEQVPIDALFVDYIQLCKFNGTGVTDNETSQVNAYVSFFRRLSQNFKKIQDPVTKEFKTKQITVLLLSQIRRDSWRKAVNHNGVYDVTCMSDSSELEKSAYRIFTTYTTEDMKAQSRAQVQILKNRTGQTMQAEPAEVYANGEAYVYCDEDGMDTNTFANTDATATLSAAFDGVGGALESLLNV